MIDVGTGIIYRDGKVLIAQRAAHKLNPGLWEFPGGKIEKGETIQECLQRELREELEIETEIGDYIMDAVYVCPDQTYVLKVYWVSIIRDKEPVLTKEHMQLSWVSFAEMSDYDFSLADIDIVNHLQALKCAC